MTFLDGKSVPTELKKDAELLRKELPYDEAQEQPTSHMDDEYAFAGAKDPKVVITTSRDPSSRLQQFSKEMKLVFPNSQRINRGTYVVKDLVNACRSNEVTDLVILHETRGQPGRFFLFSPISSFSIILDGIIISHFPYGPTAYFSLHNVVLRHDVENQGTVSEAYPHLIFNRFGSKLGERIKNILKYLFPVPKQDSQRVMTFSNENDFISFRHHVYHKVSHKEVQLAEVGPRFEMKPYQIKLGTVDIEEADNEWVFRPYMRTMKKRELLK